MEKLTRRENEIIKFVIDGKTNKDIATRLCISERTVINHLTHIYNKSPFTNRHEAMAYYADRSTKRKERLETDLKKFNYYNDRRNKAVITCSITANAGVGIPEAHRRSIHLWKEVLYESTRQSAT